MNKKSKAFTLPEALITLSVVGVLAALVVPGLIRDMTNKSLIALLKSTVTNINDAIQNELIKTRAVDMSDTDLVKDPETFFRKLDVTSIKDGNEAFATAYKTLDGNAVSTPQMTKSTMVKNGVAIGLSNTPGSPEQRRTAYFDRWGRPVYVVVPAVPASSKIYVDVNGSKEPNIHGVDFFVLDLQYSNNSNLGIHIGDIGCSDTSTNVSIATCKASGGISCFCSLERSGFNPNYLLE